MQIIELSNWKRKQHYDYFKSFKQPFFSVTANIPISALWKVTKQEGLSFLQTSLFFILKTADRVEEFRCRVIAEDTIVIHEHVGVGTTLLNDDKTFRYAVFEYQETFAKFSQCAKLVTQIPQGQLFNSNIPIQHDNLIYHSSFPWGSFTSFTNARGNTPFDSVPRIVSGKVFAQNGEFYLPLSIEANHAVVDGYNVGQFFNILEELCNTEQMEKLLKS
jgi:chloramphenicol O-acetyltransferase type A